MFGACLAMLSGCMQLAEITQLPVSAGLTGKAGPERLAQNMSKMAVRAFKPRADGKPGVGDEILGAKCTLVSDELRATVITPQEVILPRFKQRKEFANRGVPGSIVVKCNAGSDEGQVLVTAQEKQVSTAIGAGLIGAVLTTAVTAAAANSTPWSFPPSVSVVVGE